MKKIITISILFLISLCSLGQTTNSERKEKTDLEKLIFEVKLNKESYLPFEPVFVTFELSNKTNKVLEAKQPPDFLRSSQIKITNPQGKTVEIRGLSLTSGGGVNLPGYKFELKPHQSYREEYVPAIDPKVFSETGNYELQFFLNGLESNLIEMEVVSPQGLDKAAFDFISEHGKDIWFGRMLQEEEGSNVLKIFVQNYGESGYGEYAINLLGKYYLHEEKNIDKAEVEFEKIKSSENKIIAYEAKRFLKEIEQRKQEVKSKK